MARHWRHQRNRRPLRIVLSTSTGEQRHAGHDTATSSGASIQGCPLGTAKKNDLPGSVVGNRAGRNTHRGVERDTPASIGGPPHESTREHLGCQRDDVQRLAGMGLVKHEQARNGRVMSGRGRTTAIRDGPRASSAKHCGSRSARPIGAGWSWLASPRASPCRRWLCETRDRASGSGALTLLSTTA